MCKDPLFWKKKTGFLCSSSSHTHYWTDKSYIKLILSQGTPILKVSALDGDRGVPNSVNYSFSGGRHDYFSIDAADGWVRVARPMDREQDWVHALFGVLDMEILTEEVTSNPKGPTTAIAPATIRILDVNDQIPTFSELEYNARVLENTQAHVPITLVPADTDMLAMDLDEVTIMLKLIIIETVKKGLH